MPIYLSASSIADFIKCPQKVLYRLKKTIPEVKSKEMIAGIIAHSAIEKGWDNRDRAFSIIDYEVKANGLKKADKTNLEFMLDLFYLNFKGLLSDKDLIEYRFKVPLYDDVFIVGKIDRISQGRLYDWKTGRTPTKLYNDVQCIIYQWAYKKLFDKKPISIHLGALATGELLTYTEDKLYIEEIFNNIIPRMIRTVRHDSYERLGLFNHSCFRCPFKVGCLGVGGEEYVLDSSVSLE